MKINYLLYIVVVVLVFEVSGLKAQVKTDANVIGHVVCKGEHIPFVTVMVKGTTIGTSTDETGHYALVNLPLGEHIIRAQAIGFKPKEQAVYLKADQTVEINFELEEDVMGLEEIVVTADRNRISRKDATVVVNSISSEVFDVSQAASIGEGLNFLPGLRMECNCQNCGFSQLRMNGLEGPYSQILVNSRPVFSGLAGIYGLELIPSNIIDRIEVIRGGGSALYGSNAIAGTVNLILKDPINNSYEIGTYSGLIGVGMKDGGRTAWDHRFNFNTSLIGADHKSGITLYGFYRNRQHFDANKDGFSEIPSINNITVGARAYHRVGYRGKAIFDFFHINEGRRGGDRFDYLPHEANIAESLLHNITTMALSYEMFLRDYDMLSVYASGQYIDRDSYYGANHSLADYGKTHDLTYTFGVQYKVYMPSSLIVAGMEQTGGWLKDKKLGYPDLGNAIILNDSIVEIPHTENILITDQATSTTGGFAQFEHQFNRLKITMGIRFDRYSIQDHKKHDQSRVDGNVLSPRVNFLYTMGDHLQGRLNYAKGYRAPQVFDEDLHIEVSGSRKVVHRNSPGLKQEESHSFTASIDYSQQLGKLNYQFLLEGFYTLLVDPFANVFSEPDDEGVVIYTRINANDHAVVQGINTELNVLYTKKYSLNAGFTYQSARYKEPQEFDEKNFFRSPQSYGFFTLNWEPSRKFELSATGNYTGAMLIPYFGSQLPEQMLEIGELRKSHAFFDLGLKVKYKIRLNGSTLEFFVGAKNFLNSYQDDFDRGIDRDTGYIYGPAVPRAFYCGLKMGNLL